MKTVCRWLGLLIVVLMIVAAQGQEIELSPPDVGSLWVRPSTHVPAQPVWGHAEGLRVGLWPMPGPRGLLRIYAPYLGHASDRMINYIAIEPVVQGTHARSFSEMEYSALDLKAGLRFWSCDSILGSPPDDPSHPTRGVISHDGDVETLSVTICIEPYQSGAIVIVCLTFRADRPYEVGISTYQAEGSRPLSACIVTATMGNFARLRELHLLGRRVHAISLWPGFTGSGFTEHATFPRQDLLPLPGGGVLVAATPDEAIPDVAVYAPHTLMGWKYYGDVATQTWRCEDAHPLCRVSVNGRVEYWASHSPIPGGLAFENFELIEPFRAGATYWFGVFPGRDDWTSLLDSD